MAMNDYPGALPPPPGYTPDMEHPQDVLRTIMYVTQGLTLLFTTLFVGLRVYAKKKILDVPSGWDDCMDTTLL